MSLLPANSTVEPLVTNIILVVERNKHSFSKVMLLTFCLIAYSVFGWTPAEFEGKIGLYAEYLKEAKEETRDKVKLFGWSIGPIGPSLASNYLGV